MINIDQSSYLQKFENKFSIYIENGANGKTLTDMSIIEDLQSLSILNSF